MNTFAMPWRFIRLATNDVWITGHGRQLLCDNLPVVPENGFFCAFCARTNPPQTFACVDQNIAPIPFFIKSALLSAGQGLLWPGTGTCMHRRKARRMPNIFKTNAHRSSTCLLVLRCKWNKLAQLPARSTTLALWQEFDIQVYSYRFWTCVFANHATVGMVSARYWQRLWKSASSSFSDLTWAL